MKFIALEKFSLKKKKIKIFLNLFVFFFGIFLRKDFNFFAEVKKNYYQEREPCKKLIRMENSILFSRKGEYRTILKDFSFFPQNFLNNYFEKNKFFLFFYLVAENIDQIRKIIIEKLIFKKNVIQKNKIKNSKILIIVPNQTSLFQLIQILFYYGKEREKKTHTGLLSKNLCNKDFLNIKLGKIIKPADFKRNFLNGQEDFINLNCSFKKNKINFGKKKKADFLFLTPVFLRSLDKKSLSIIFKNSFFCFVDNFQLIYMQNSENLSFILKNFFLPFRANGTKKKKFLKKPFRVKLSEVFILSNYFQSSFLFIQKSNCFSKIFLKKAQTLKKQTFNSKVKNWILLFDWNKNISKIQNLLLILKKSFDKTIFKKSQRGVLIFCRDYSEFIFIRNYLWKNIRGKKVRLVMFHEYLDNFEKNRRINSEQKDFRRIILITERFYFFNRFPILNVETIFFFYRPKEIEYFFEICNFFKENEKNKNIFSIQNSFKK